MEEGIGRGSLRPEEAERGFTPVRVMEGDCRLRL